MEKLLLEAQRAFKYRGHTIKTWEILVHQDTYTGFASCAHCGATVTFRTHPAPNQAHIVGSAVAIGCVDE